jgi:hypothetical protein
MSEDKRKAAADALRRALGLREKGFQSRFEGCYHSRVYLLPNSAAGFYCWPPIAA